MTQYVVWDIETCQAETSWCTVLELAAIWLDENFKEKERFKVRCRIPQDRVPSATALCINRTNYDLLTKTTENLVIPHEGSILKGTIHSRGSRYAYVDIGWREDALLDLQKENSKYVDSLVEGIEIDVIVKKSN